MNRPETLPSRIVVRGANWVGDTVMSLPAAREVRRIFPRAQLTFWIPSGLAPLIRATGIPDDILLFDRESGRQLMRPFRVRKQLVEGRFDMAILFQNAFESAFTSWLARIPTRAGYPTDLRGPLLTLQVPLHPGIRRKHEVFYYLAITDFLEQYFHGASRKEPASVDCSVRMDALSIGRARSLLSGVGIDSHGPLFCLCPGSVNSEAKRWPGDYFARLADLLIERMDARVVFLGAPNESTLVEGIISEMRGKTAVNLAGRGDMIASMAVMGMSRMVISNDTGSAHLAVSAGARVLTLFGPTSPGATAPYGPGAHIIQGEAPCAPCRHFRCPRPHHACMRSLKPEAVLRRAEWILLSQPRSRAR
jgi:heptosyltransferase-2